MEVSFQIGKQVEVVWGHVKGIIRWVCHSYSFSRLLLQPVSGEQVDCCEAIGVWLEHIAYTVNHRSKKPTL